MGWGFISKPLLRGVLVQWWHGGVAEEPPLEVRRFVEEPTWLRRGAGLAADSLRPEPLGVLPWPTQGTKQHSSSGGQEAGHTSS